MGKMMHKSVISSVNANPRPNLFKRKCQLPAKQAVRPNKYANTNKHLERTKEKYQNDRFRSMMICEIKYRHI